MGILQLHPMAVQWWNFLSPPPPPRWSAWACFVPAFPPTLKDGKKDELEPKQTDEGH